MRFVRNPVNFRIADSNGVMIGGLQSVPKPVRKGTKWVSTTVRLRDGSSKEAFFEERTGRRFYFYIGRWYAGYISQFQRDGEFDLTIAS